jgi:GT2 family glycosyltransferase
MPGIVIVTFNSADVIEDCVKACLRLPDASIVVVDNASTDNTVNRVPRAGRVRLIANVTNRGFAGAVNQGIEALPDFEEVLILNPDAVPVQGIDELERAVQRDGVGAATGRLVNAEGREQHGFNVRALPTAATLALEALGINRMWPSNPVNRRYRQQIPAQEAVIEQPAGAFLMVNRRIWAELRGLDDSFFPIWFEDVDFCKRMRDAGYSILYVPNALARHSGGHSAGKLSWRERQLFWYGSLLRYASKHMSRRDRGVVCAAVMLASVGRTLTSAPQFGVAESFAVYSKVVWLAVQCLRKGERGLTSPAMLPGVVEERVVQEHLVRKHKEQSKQSR